MIVEGRHIELMTWYSPGDGIVQQEQRTEGHLDFKLVRIAGE